jgi:hypothetical protein
MRVLPFVFLAACVGMLAACAEVPATPTRADSATCVALFQEFDTLERTTPNPRPSRRTAANVVEWQGTRLRQAGCLTTNADLANLARTPDLRVTESGPAIRPISVHAGVVSSDADAARVVDFFEARGVRTRTVGNGVLGRRIYLGPFATQGGVESAIALAQAAGFIAPYPASF